MLPDNPQGPTDEQPKNAFDPMGNPVPMPEEPSSGVVTPEPPIQLGDIDPNSAEGIMKQQEIVTEQAATFKSWQDWRRPFEGIWAECYRAFMSVLSGQKTFTRARVFVPVAFQVIEAAVPKLVNIILGQVPFFEVQAEMDKDMDVAKVIQNILEYQLSQADFFIKFVDFAKQLMLYGTSYFYIYWKVKRAWVYERVGRQEPLTFMGLTLGHRTVWEKKLTYKVIERRPELEVLDIADVYPDPEARTEKDASGMFIESRMPLAELEEMGRGRFPVYANTDKLRGTTSSKGTQAADIGQVRQDRRGIRGLGTQHVLTSSSESMVTLRTFWGLRDLDGDGIREEVLIVVANGTVLLKAIRNPFEHQQRPLVRSVLFSVPLEWYGLGLLEPILPLISELNTLRNQGLDVNNLIINRMWKVNSMADIDLDTLISAPNGIVLTDMMDGLEPLAQAELPNSVYEDSTIIQRDIENTTTPRSVQGTPESGSLGRTSSGATLIINQALEKFGMAAKLTEESAIKKVLKFFHQLNLQFIDDEQTWSVDSYYGPVYNDKVSPEMLRAEVRFKLLGLSETITKEAKINQIISFLTVFKGMPGIDFLEAARSVWRLMDTGEAADKIVQPAPFPNTLVTQQMASPSPLAGDDAQAMANQVAANGASSPAAIPGKRSM